MHVDLTIILDDHPGALANACQAMGRAGVNIEGLCAFASSGIGILHAAVDDVISARRAVEAAGYRISEEREVLIVDIEDRPGSAGAMLRHFGDAEVNLDLVYFATQTRMVVSAQDFEKAKAALESHPGQA